MAVNAAGRLAAALCLVIVAFPISCFAETIVATRSIRAGTILSPGDVMTDPETIAGAAQRAQDVIGLEVRRNLYAGRPVLTSDLGPPTLVKRNSRVSIIYRSPGLALRTEGRALDSGGAGETIRVMNISSRTNIFATVRSSDTVEVSP